MPYTRPALYWLATIGGLVLALLDDQGVGDAVALVLVAAPLAGLMRHLARPKPPADSAVTDRRRA